MLAVTPRISRTRALSSTVIALCFAAVADQASAVPLGLPATNSQDPPSVELVTLGRQLFADKRLSADGTISCTSCHVPAKRFTDGRPTARGLRGQKLTRHTPSLLNVRYASSLFWDGRAGELATQARAPLLAPAEHGLANERSLKKIVGADTAYAAAFEHLFGVKPEQISMQDVGTALAAYEQTLVAADSEFDRYQYGHDPKAMSPGAIRGLALFRGRAQCASCHEIGDSSALLSDGKFHASPVPMPASALARLGKLAERVSSLRHRGDLDALSALIATDRNASELGRFVVTLDPKDIGLFKTPSLRNVSVTGPYMHSGSVTSLAAALDMELYSRSTQKVPLVLTEDERSDLLAFLDALTSS